MASNATNPVEQAAGLNLLAIFPLCFDKPLRGAAGSRGTNEIMDVLSALVAGDYTSAIDRFVRRGDKRASLPPAPPTPRPDPDDPSASPPPLTIRQMSTITDLIRVGNLSKAASALTPARAAAATSLNIETVTNLFPARTCPLDLPSLRDLLPTCPSVTVSLTDTVAALRKTNLHRGKSEGVTGFTNSHLLDLTGVGAKQDKPLIAALAGFATAYLNGSFIDVPQADWLTRARFVPLVKTETDNTPKVASNGGDAIRPLGMQETLTNFCARCFLTDVRLLELLNIFEPLGQYGVGTRSGCHAVALAVTTWLAHGDPFSDDALAVLQSDIINAFNTFETMPALQSVHKHYPSLFPSLMFSYARDRELLWSTRRTDGDPLIRLTSQRGSSQGDVFASLFYAFAAIEPLISTRAAFPDTNLALIVDDAHFNNTELLQANAAFAFYAAEMDARGLGTNVPKSYAYASNVDLTTDDVSVSALCTPRPPSSGVVSVGTPIGSDSFVVDNVGKRLAPYLSQLSNLTYYAKHHPEEAFRLLELCFARRADFLAGAISPHLARAHFDAYDAAMAKVLRSLFPSGPPTALYWPAADGGWGLARPYAVSRPAIFVRSQLEAARTLVRLCNPTARHLIAPGSTFTASLSTATALLPPGNTIHLELQALLSTADSTQLTNAELLSVIEIARELVSTAVPDCGKQLVPQERALLTDQQRHVIAGNAPTSALSPTVSWHTGSLDQPHGERLTGQAWLDLAHLSLAVCPPSLSGWTAPGDPLGRAALSHKSGGGLIKRHNLATVVVHQLEREANRASRLEVPALYPGTEMRVDTHCCITTGSGNESTDVRVLDPHTAARVQAGTTVEATIKAAEKEKHDKYNSPSRRAIDGSTLSALVFTPGGRIGPTAEQYLRRLAKERASINLPPGEPPDPSALAAIYRRSRRRLAHSIARGLALQIAIYGLERRVGPPSAAALRAAYPQLATPAPYTILGLRSSTARSPTGRTHFRKRSVRSAGK